MGAILLLNLLIAGFFIWLVFRLFTSMRTATDVRYQTESDNPIDILHKRLAAGEVSVEEFERILPHLENRVQHDSATKPY